MKHILSILEDRTGHSAFQVRAKNKMKTVLGERIAHTHRQHLSASHYQNSGMFPALHVCLSLDAHTHTHSFDTVIDHLHEGYIEDGMLGHNAACISRATRYTDE